MKSIRKVFCRECGRAMEDVTLPASLFNMPSALRVAERPYPNHDPITGARIFVIARACPVPRSWLTWFVEGEHDQETMGDLRTAYGDRFSDESLDAMLGPAKETNIARAFTDRAYQECAEGTGVYH